MVPVNYRRGNDDYEAGATGIAAFLVRAYYTVAHKRDLRRV